MADSDVLKSYQPRNYPRIPGAEARYFQDELQKLSNSISLLISVVKALEQRIAALEP